MFSTALSQTKRVGMVSEEEKKEYKNKDRLRKKKERGDKEGNLIDFDLIFTIDCAFALIYPL